MVLTKINYDAMGRLTTIYKNIDGAASNQLISTLQYNELGKLRNKALGNSLDNLTYDYNIRGWVTGINKNYVGRKDIAMLVQLQDFFIMILQEAIVI